MCVVLANLFNPAEAAENYDLELAEDVRGEASKCGAVEKLVVDRDDPRVSLTSYCSSLTPSGIGIHQVCVA